MAQTTTINLLTQQSHPAGSDPIEVYGEKEQAAAYLLANRDLQTLTWHFSGTFVGNCKIQASLETDPGSDDWFDVYTVDTVSEKDGYHNQTGNFVWLRAVVTGWTQGTIQLVTVSY
jgi:hypothetical protein